MKSPSIIYRLIINGIILSTIFASILYPSPTSANTQEFISDINHDSILPGLTTTIISAPDAPDAEIILPVDPLTTDEAGGSDNFTVVLDEAPAADVTIPVVSSNESEGTVDIAELIFTISDWFIPQTVTVTGQDDAVDDDDQDYTIDLGPAISADANFNGLVDSISVTNLDDDTAGISAAPLSLVTSETGIADTFTVTLTSEPIEIVHMVLVITDTTEGVLSVQEFAFNNNTWNDPYLITVTGLDDTEYDGDVTYAIQIQVREDSDPLYLTVPTVDVSVTNLDDESPIVVSPLDLTTSEDVLSDTYTDTFTVSLTTAPTATVTIDLSSSDLGEGTVSPATLTFTETGWITPRTVTVTGVDDDIDDGDQPYTIVTGAAVSADPNYSGLDVPDVSVINLDDDLGSVTVSSPSGPNTTEAGDFITFTLVLDSAPSEVVTISVGSSDAGEGTADTAQLTFTSTDWDDPQTVTVTGEDDDLDDGDQAYTINLGDTSSADPDYAGITVADVSLTNLDDDLGSVTVGSPSGLNTTEAGGFITFTVVLDSAPSEVVTISVGSSNEEEGTVDTTQLTFTSSDWDDPQTVTVTGEDDFVDDEDQAYTINLGDTSSADPDYAGITVADVSLTNLDDDTAGVTADPSSGLITTEAGITATFTIVLNSEPTRLVNVVPNSSETTEGQVPSTPLRFDNTDWNIPQQVIITGQDDNDLDGDQPYSIQFLVYSSDDKYELIGVDEVSVTNLDDEDAGISVWPQANLSTDESGGWAEFNVRLDAQPTASVTVTLYSSDESEGTIDRTYLTFTPGDYSTSQKVKITGVDDDIDDGDQPYTIITESAISDDENYNGEEVADISVTNIDNDVAGFDVTPTSGLVTTEAGGDDTFTIRLTSQPTATVTIALSSNNSSEGTVDTSQLTFTSADWDDPQTVTVTGEDDDLVDGDVGYAIVTAPAVSADPVYDGLNPSNVSVTNLDNDESVDTELPTISWVLPIEKGSQYEITNAAEDRFFELVAEPNDNNAIDRVIFKRWDPYLWNDELNKEGDFVNIDKVYSEPYRTVLDTSTLNCGFNQINAEAIDVAENSNEIPTDKESIVFIWLIRYCYLYMPSIAK